MSQDDMLKSLQSRIKLLRQLIFEIPFYAQGYTNTDVLKSELSTDPDLLFAFIYLNTQIISLLNKLNSLHALIGISPELSARVEYFVQIRNVLEHNDPVIDSLEDSYVEMASKSHMTLCDIAMEFNVKFYDVLMKATPKEFLHQALDVPPVGLTKQRTAMTLSSGNNYLFFERKPLKELYSDQRSVVLTATIENNNNN